MIGKMIVLMHRYKYVSDEILKTKNVLDLIVVGILLTDPVWVIDSKFIPKPVSQVRVKLSIWVKPITRLDHVLRITPFSHLTL